MTGPVNRSAKATRTLDIVGLAMVGLITAVNWVGMYAAAYAEIPEGADGWKVAGTSRSISLHMLLGILLVGGAVYHLVLAIRGKKLPAILCSAIGFGGLAGAIASGSVFLSMQDDVLALVMAASAAVSLLAYVAGIFVAKGRKPGT